MILDFEELSASQRYFQTIQTLLPRPIAWVLSENESGGFNLAPFSYFTAVCSEPPLVMLSMSKKTESELKDSCANIAERRNFVIHIPSRNDLEAMNASSATLPAGVSEVEQLGLELTEFDGFPLPRLASAKVAYGCSLYEVKEIGSGPQTLIFGKVERMFLDDAILEERSDDRIKVDAAKLDPVARLGAGEYAFLTDIAKLVRPD